jgi:hypothetical protein
MSPDWVGVRGLDHFDLHKDPQAGVPQLEDLVLEVLSVERSLGVLERISVEIGELLVVEHLRGTLRQPHLALGARPRMLVAVWTVISPVAAAMAIQLAIPGTHDAGAREAGASLLVASAGCFVVLVFMTTAAQVQRFKPTTLQPRRLILFEPRTTLMVVRLCAANGGIAMGRRIMAG